MRILYKHASRLHATNPPGAVAQQYDVAAQTLHREIFINGADDGALRLGYNGIKSVIRNRAAAGDRSEPAPAPSPDRPSYTIAMKISATPATASIDSFRKHLHDCIKVSPLEIPVRIGAADQIKKFVFRPLFSRAHGHQLLRQNVHWIFRDLQSIQIALPHGTNQRRTLY